MSTLASYEHLRSRLTLALALNATIIIAEFSGGWILNSIGLMSDAGHNLVDQGALFLALYTHLLTARPATAARTFGYHRAGIIAALLNSFILLLTAVGITFVGFQRLLHPVPVDGAWIMAIAALSFAANLSIALLLQQGAKDNLNIRSAFWHMLGDAWVSLGVVISGAAILFAGWTIFDPLISLLVVMAIAKGAWLPFKESLEILMESTPAHLSATQVATTIGAIPGVKNVHDLHIWAVEPRLIMLTCHILVDGDDSAMTNDLLQTIRTTISAEFGINHVTIQIGTACCEPHDIHCDLTTLLTRHPDEGLIHH